jgi:hypothetical protein
MVVFKPENFFVAFYLFSVQLPTHLQFPVCFMEWLVFEVACDRFALTLGMPYPAAHGRIISFTLQCLLPVITARMYDQYILRQFQAVSSQWGAALGEDTDSVTNGPLNDHKDSLMKQQLEFSPANTVNTGKGSGCRCSSKSQWNAGLCTGDGSTSSSGAGCRGEASVAAPAKHDVSSYSAEDTLCRSSNSRGSTDKHVKSSDSINSTFQGKAAAMPAVPGAAGATAVSLAQPGDAACGRVHVIHGADASSSNTTDQDELTPVNSLRSVGGPMTGEAAEAQTEAALGHSTPSGVKPKPYQSCVVVSTTLSIKVRVVYVDGVALLPHCYIR